ncbi:MAG: hypothetical protein Q8O56_04730 [Solirubrobacteraceae bacterium]|nr:hypothetical protein [Solirubrobacteraceae bacterium]
MSDVSAGRQPGPGDGPTGPWNGGSPPPVLLGALGAAGLIAVLFIALVASSGGGDGSVSAGAGATEADTRTRVLLTVAFKGNGDGRVEISPGDIVCDASCEHRFAPDTRVTVTADPASGATFEGWGDACDGTGRCLIVLTRNRALSATFEEPVAPVAPRCEDDDAGDPDPSCPDEDVLGDEPIDDPPRPPSDCADGIDNDGDGLIDSAQDPGCAENGTEAGTNPAPGTTATPRLPGTTTPPGTRTRPPPASVDECSDDIDNDGDGLIDAAQDPGCANNSRTEDG